MRTDTSAPSADTGAEPITPDGLRQLRILLEEGASGYTRHTVASLLAERDRKVVALNAALAKNAAHERTIARLREQLDQAKAAPGPAGETRVWSGYDDDECWFPMFATLADAKAYAEQAYRAQCAAFGADVPEEVSWTERKPYTESHGHPGMFELEAATGWVVCELLVHSSLASGLAERPIETGGEVSKPEPQIEGQTVIALAGTEADR